MGIMDSGGSHKEGCHICGGFPGNASKPVNVLYQCGSCSFFTCNKHTSMENLQKVCPHCHSPKLKAAMSQSDVRKMKKGGMPGSDRLASEINKTAKKGKGFTPLAGGSGGGERSKGLFGGGGLFGAKKPSDEEIAKAKLDEESENTTNIKVDSNADTEITVKLAKDGDVKAKSSETDPHSIDEDDDLTVSIKLGKDSKSGKIKVSFTEDETEKKHKTTGYYNAAEEGTPFKGKISDIKGNTHAPVPTGLGDQADRSDLKKPEEEVKDGEEVIVVVEKRFENSGADYNPESKFGKNREVGAHLGDSAPVGTGSQVADTQGIVELNDTNIDHILDAVLDDDDLAQQLMDQIADEDLKKLVEDYLSDEEEEEEDGEIDEDEKAKKKRRKKSKILREYAKSLQPAAAKGYTTEQVFKELDKSISVYIEHPNDETKPNFLHPTLADAFFKPSLEGISSMSNRAGEFYSSKSKGPQKTVSIVQFDLKESARTYYENLLSEDSLILGAVSYGPRNVNSFNREKLIESLEDIPGIVAIGTIGLDMHFAPNTLEKQKQIFKEHIEVAEEYQLPILIVSEKADKELIELFKEIKTPNVPLIFASTIENEEICKLCLDMNMYIILRSEITLESYKDTYLKYVSEIPSDKWLLASGSEFIIPTKINEEYIGSGNPLIAGLAPEQNNEGKTLVTSDSSFISKKDSATQKVSDNWNKPELIRDTLEFLLQHFNKKKHPFHRELTENFIYVFNGSAAKELRQNIKNSKDSKLAKKLKEKEKAQEKKVLVIRAE